MVLIIRLPQGTFRKYDRIYINYLFSRIYYYSATQTSDAAYIIGGVWMKSVIAEFKNDKWRRLDDLNIGRKSHGSITLGSQTMIIGGTDGSGYPGTE